MTNEVTEENQIGLPTCEVPASFEVRLIVRCAAFVSQLLSVGIREKEEHQFANQRAAVSPAPRWVTSYARLENHRYDLRGDVPDDEKEKDCVK